MKRLVIFGMLFLSVFLLGCTSTNVQRVDSSAPVVSVNVSPEQVPTVKIARVGESLTNGKLKITLNSVEFMEIIPNENEFLVANAKSGKTFAIVDVTLENVDTEASSISEFLFKVSDSEGYNYQFAFTPTVSLGMQIGGTIQPGSRSRGKLAFEVPKTSTGLQLIFNFGILDHAQAKFNLGDAR